MRIKFIVCAGISITQGVPANEGKIRDGSGQWRPEMDPADEGKTRVVMQISGHLQHAISATDRRPDATQAWVRDLIS